MKRKRAFRPQPARSLALIAFGVAVVVGCGESSRSDESGDAGAAGDGARGGTQGGSATGGASRGGSGGTSGDGGSGATASGGTNGEGGADGGQGGGTSGTDAGGGTDVGGSGGAGAFGGMGIAGGAGGTAGASSGGGAGTNAGTGGAASGGAGNAGGAGSAGKGGTSSGGTGGVSCGATWSVASDGYVTSSGNSGCWQGFAFTAKSDPVTTILPANFLTCGSPCNLCANGTLAVGDSATALLGFDIAQPRSSTTRGALIPRGATLIVNFIRGGSYPMRVQIESLTGSERWCYETGSPVGPIQIPWTSFNTQCWSGGTGTAYARQAIAAVSLVIPGATTGPRTYTMCLTGAQDS